MVNLELGTVDNGKSMSEILRDALEAKGLDTAELQPASEKELFQRRRVEKDGIYAWVRSAPGRTGKRD